MTIQADLPIRILARRRAPSVFPARADWLVPALFLAPAFLTLGAWIYWPLIEAFRLSFYEWNLLPTSDPEFVGLENYRNLLALTELRAAAWNTVVYTFGLLPLTVGLPLIVALWTREAVGRAGPIYRALIFIPMIIAPVVVAVVWRWMLNPDHGIVNKMLEAIGFAKVRFLQDPDTAIWTIIFITGWKLVGFSTLLFAAAMTNIDRGLVEAARIDGASESQIAWRVIAPLVTPTTIFLSVLTVLHGAQWSFVYINVLTQGGPLNSTTNLYFLLWEYGFSTFAIGWSTAAGMMLFAVFSVFALIGLKLMGRHDERVA
jgi:multiple sugar transport system permease protein